jgi:hypothetical protein
MATLDILTEVEASEAASGVDTATLSTELPRMVTAVSARIDELVGPVVNRTITEYHDGGGVIRPRQTPVSSVTTLTNWDGSTQTSYTADTWGVAGNANGFLIEQSGSYPHDTLIYRRSSGTSLAWPNGHRNLKLVYVTGRAATTATVDARYKECAAEVLRRLWDRESSAWARGSSPFGDDNVSSRFFKAFDYVVAEMLGDEMKMPGIA